MKLVKAMIDVYDKIGSMDIEKTGNVDLKSLMLQAIAIAINGEILNQINRVNRAIDRIFPQGNDRAFNRILEDAQILNHGGILVTLKTTTEEIKYINYNREGDLCVDEDYIILTSLGKEPDLSPELVKILRQRAIKHILEYLDQLEKMKIKGERA